ncbi:MAG TPA: sulfatase-like hydrolase/transferase [Actinomycetota bacterium]
MRSGPARIAAGLAAATVLGIVAVAAPSPASARPDRPNIVLIVTDDQRADSLTTEPVGMPWLRAQLDTPGSGWLWFPEAYVTTPLCCPSRATLLTGEYARHHGVTSNHDGRDLDEADTVAVWLRDAGYRTALVGKYLNEYPWDRGPYVPPGWDRWLAKTNEALATTYYGYGLVDQGRSRLVGRGQGDHAVDVLGRAALDFVAAAPHDAPWFLAFTPPAPHPPWVPRPIDAGTLPAPAPVDPAALNDVAGKPAWIQGRDEITPARSAVLDEDRRRASETLLGVDAYLEALVRLVAARGELDRTVFVVMSDNGYQFGEQRWEGKLLPYDDSIRVPLAIRTPWSPGGTVRGPVANVDVAPTLAELAGVTAGTGVDGVSLAEVVRGRAGTAPARPPLLIEWAGGPGVPAWSGVVTERLTYVRWADGTEEVYDRVADPDQLRNLAGRDDAQLTMLRAALARFGGS